LFHAHCVFIRFAAANLLKISLFQSKKGLKATIFHKKSNFFSFFVVFLNTLPYICQGFRYRNIFFIIYKSLNLQQL